MSSFKEMLINEVVMPVIVAQPKTTLALVESYDPATNMASIKLINMNGTISNDIIEHVPVMVHNGLKPTAPFPGDRVIVSFLDGQFGSPVIIGVYERTYGVSTRETLLTHRMSGAYLPDKITDRVFSWEGGG